MYGIDNINDIGDMFTSLGSTSLEAMERQCNLILCAIEEGWRLSGDKGFNLTVDDIFAEITEQPDLIQRATEMFIESVQQKDGAATTEKKT